MSKKVRRSTRARVAATLRGVTFLLTLGATAPTKVYGQSYDFTILAGTPAEPRNHLDGPVEAARFNHPAYVAISNSGDLYISDLFGLRQVKRDGTVTTVVGAEGTPVKTQRLAVDSAGRVCFAYGRSMAYLEAGGSPRQLAGDVFVPGYVDGVGDNARFGEIADIAADAAGNVYVYDAGNLCIRKISFDRTVTTFAEGIGDARSRTYVPRISADRAGNVYVLSADASADGFSVDRYSLRRYSAAGSSTMIATLSILSAPSASDATSVYVPSCVAADGSGNVFVSDSFKHVVMRISSSGSIEVFAGAPWKSGFEDGPGQAARLDEPQGLAVDGSGNVYVADWAAGTIRRITSQGVVTTAAGRPPAADGVGRGARFGEPCGVGIDAAGNLIVADTNNAAIRRVSPTGTTTTLFRGAPLVRPVGVAIDRDGAVLIADAGFPVIRRLAPDGSIAAFAGSSGGSADGPAASAQFLSPQGIAIDQVGNVFIADGGGTWDGTTTQPQTVARSSILYNNTIRRIGRDGIVTTLAGHARDYGVVDGEAFDARFVSPLGIGIARSGNLIVTDGVSLSNPIEAVGRITWTRRAVNAAVRIVTLNGDVSTVAGSSRSGYIDDASTAAIFATPHGVAVERSGGILVADTANGAIRRISPSGLVTTVWVSGELGQTPDSSIAGRINSPRGLALDPLGNLYVTAGSVILKGTPMNAPRPPIVSAQPTLQTSTAGTVSVTFSTIVTGEPAPAVQWFNEGRLIAGATRTSFTLPNVQPADVGRYYVEASNSAGTVRAEVGSLGPPRFQLQPQPRQVVTLGQAFYLSAQFTALPAATFQWFRDGKPVSGLQVLPASTPDAMATSFSVENAHASDGGRYTVVASNALGSTTSEPALVSISRTPIIEGQTPSILGLSGSNDLALGVRALGESPFTYRWEKNAGEFAASEQRLTLQSAPASSGTYRCTVSNAYGSATSAPIRVIIVGQPTLNAVPALAVFANQAVTATIEGADAGVTLQWRKNGHYISGATTTRLALTKATVTDAGDYTVEVHALDFAGTVSSSAARLSVFDAPAIAQPAVNSSGPKFLAGLPISLTAPSLPSGAAVQWMRSGMLIPGATNLNYIMPAPMPEDSGDYALLVANQPGTARSDPIAVVVDPTSRLTNLSAIANLGPGRPLVLGFSVSSGAAAPVLIRGVGPSLAAFGATPVGAQPRLELYEYSQLVAVNANWGSTAELLNAFARAGAFPLGSGSVEAALLLSITGSRTAQLSVASPGNALIELYELGRPSYDPNREPRPTSLINLSARYRASSINPLVAGFTIGGIGHKNVLIRGVGPALRGRFGINDTVADPKLQLFDMAGHVIAENDDWPDATQSQFAVVGAFPLAAGSKDAALLLRLSPGSYTAVMRPGDAAGGEGLIEIYEMP